MDRQEQTRIVASMTDDELELKQLRDHLFGEPPTESVDLGQPKPKSSNVVPGEGANPEAPPITDDAYMRDFTRRMFDPDYAFYEQELPEQENQR